jgi:hypothetical protein
MKRKVILITLLLGSAILGVVLWRNDSAKQVKPDGTVLVLSGTKIGRSNVYTHGTMPSRLLGGLVPSNGLSGWPAEIRFVNTDMLSVELTNKPSHLRMTFVDARDDEGNNLDNWIGSWGQHSFWKSLKLSKPTTVHATVAIRENYEADVTLQPRLERVAARQE